MDRAYGGVSLIMHVEGANRPNSPLSPEYVKADVYFPGYLFYEDAHFPPIISRFTQQFITDIGLPVIERWERCARLKWSLTQGLGNPPPPPYPDQNEQPVAIPNGSSIFIIHGRRVAENDSDDGYSQFDSEPSSMELEMFDIIERNAYLEDELNSLRQELTETKKALSDALAREYTLNVQLSSMSSFAQSSHSSSSPSSPSRRTLTYTSPLRGPVTPRKPTLFKPSTPGPVKHSGSSRLLETPRFEQTSDVRGARLPHSTESFADYHEFLNFHNISHLTSTLEYIRNNIPISSWPEHMEKLAIPSEQISSMVSFLLSASSASSL